jgi:UDP-N-acetylmuramoyl-L-alanyl-D-glutamate--2,6-diaminopimelate ligase
MKLTELLDQIPRRAIHGDPERDIATVEFDSRAVVPGSLFVAVRGTQVDGHQFIAKAIALGAIAIVAEKVPSPVDSTLTWVEVEDSQAVLGLLMANYYGNPARELVMLGVTGTNGKTTIATLLHQLFTRLGIKAGLVSTIRNLIGEVESPATHTTPDPKQLHRLFREMVDQGCEVCCMEVSSHALAQHRTAGIPFQVGIFTNLTHDHLDYHGTFKAYLQAKKQLFDQLGTPSVALINLDDRNGRVMVQNTAAQVKTYSLQHLADFRARLLENTFEGLLLDLEGEQVWFRLRGSFNASNLLAVYGAAVSLGHEPRPVLQALSLLEGAEGRFQVIRHPHTQQTAIVDYAHTPDALKNVLETIHDINRGDSRVITVVGCGGNRDRAKRPEMGRLAAQQSDQAIFTSDNPRDEVPEAILDDMIAGVPAEFKAQVLCISNRREAIRTAVQLAQPGDVIVVAGKGHETYQEIKGVKYPFDDREVIREAMKIPTE